MTKTSLASKFPKLPISPKQPVYRKRAKKATTTAPAAQPAPASPQPHNVRLSLPDALDAAYDADGNPKPKLLGFQKGDPRIWRGGRPSPEGVGFSAWRAFAREFGDQPAYRRDGTAIIWMGKHLTFIENILLTWCLDNRLMGLFTDVAYGKVPQTIDIDTSTPTVIHVSLVAAQPAIEAAADGNPAQIVDGHVKVE